MGAIQSFIDSQLSQGRSFFTKQVALSSTGLSVAALRSSISRLIQKGILVSPRQGFYLILRPEDRVLGASDPARWIDPLMKFQKIDYRVSLLRAAALHGASHQAVMVFQVIAPQQLSTIEIGRQRMEFLYQASSSFRMANRPEWLAPLQTDTGVAKAAGVELTLLDTSRYFHRAGGINGVAQVAYELGSQANTRKLGQAAEAYENSTVRRLGYLLERFGHAKQANALRPSSKEAKSFKPLDPSVKPIVPELAMNEERNSDWKLIINVPVEIDR